MLRVENTVNGYGVAVSGDFLDLDTVYDASHRYLEVYYNTHKDSMDYRDYEYLLSLNYDIRHACMAHREFDLVENEVGAIPSMFSPGEIEEYEELYDEICADMPGSMPKKSEADEWQIRRLHTLLGKTYQIDEEDLRREEQLAAMVKYRKALSYGNLYFKVEFLYPLFMHYLMAYRMVLEEEPTEALVACAIEKASFPSTLDQNYSLLQAQNDRHLLQFFFSQAWMAMREHFGKETVDKWDRILANKLPLTQCPTLYTDALMHIQIATFPDMSDEDKKEFLRCSFYEICELNSGYRRSKQIQSLTDRKKEQADRVKAFNERQGKTMFVTQSMFDRMLARAFPGQSSINEGAFYGFMKEHFGACVLDYPVM